MNWNSAVGIPLIIIGAVVLALIYWYGQPKKPAQGERRPDKRVGETERVEPTLGTPDAQGVPAQGELDVSLRHELDLLSAEVADRDADPLPAPTSMSASTPTPPTPVPAPTPAPTPARASTPAPTPVRSSVGVRPDHQIERIVTLYVAARTGSMLAASDIVVAAEKAGLEFGDMGIFHRLAPGKKGEGPVFSMASMVKPGHFDMTQIDSTQTPGVTLFMTLPGPLAALDAWEMMLPTAQRLAELLDAHVLDEGRNTLGRQRIAHIRDELRAWDRQQERNQIRPER
ncbi:MAG: cell division protein ZipA [Rhodanobacter sp.]|jgi:cell division protein ZipA|nr:cell division protein ZipA [Rhodanobacter sp.]